MAAISIGFAVAVGDRAQTFEPAATDSPDQTMAGGVRKLLSDRPFFGTESVLTLNGSYVNTPKEDYEQTGVWDVWDLPLSLDQMHGMIAEISFGGSDKQGQWQTHLPTEDGDRGQRLAGDCRCQQFVEPLR